MGTRKTKITALLTVAVVAALLVGALSLSALAAPKAGVGAAPNSDEETRRLLNLTGAGVATAAPDVVYVTLGVDVRSESASEAVSESTDRMTKVMDAVKALEIDEKDIRTVSYNMWVEEDYDKDGKRTGVRTYHVVNQLQVTLRDLTLVGTVLEDALEAGANSVGGVQFAIEDTTALQREAREKAMADAKARAEQLAEGLGVTLGAPATIAEYDSSPIIVERAAYGIGGGMAEAAAPVPVAAGELSVRVQINVAWLIE
ncbi:MAG: SIMPL domain-containing protein [Chloroflexi bacterium]|nr:SIMPL domain-containing protein [Chloroflexota bacterium]